MNNPMIDSPSKDTVWHRYIYSLSDRY